jgi:O-antigen/teichoic acid export membrane protein
MSVRTAALWSMGAQYVSFLIQFVVSVLISRFFLAPAEVGLFSIALATAMVISILQDFGITRYVSGQPNLDETQARTCTTVSLIVAWGIALVVLAAAWPIARFYGDDRLVTLIAIIAGSYLFVPFSTVPTALLIRDMNYQALFAVYVGSTFFGWGVALALAAAGYSAASLAWAMIVQAAARALISQYYKRTLPRWPITSAEAKPILGFGSSSMILAVSGAIGQRSQDLVVGRIISVEATGLYSRATALGGQLSVLVTGAINGVFYPAFARLRDQGEALGKPYIRVVAGNTAINWAAMAGLSAAAEPLIRALYGEKWIAAAPLLQWTALAEMCFVAIPLHMDIPILLGQIKTLIRYNLLDTSVAISLLAIGAMHSLEGAAISRLGYGLIWILIYIRFQHNLIQFQWRALLSVYLKSGLAAAAAVVPMLAAYHFWHSPATMTFAQLLLCSGAGMFCWLATLTLLRHPVCTEFWGIAQSLLARLGLRKNGSNQSGQAI